MNNAARILSIDCSKSFESAVREVSEVLRNGEVAALPTETVYGLAANALDPRAVERIFALKGRPPGNPIIVHVADLKMARECVDEWPECAETLAAAFWPGPLTFVLRRSSRIPDVVTAKGETVGVRWPRHPFIQEVIRKCGFPLAAPSANLSNSLSPTCPEHVNMAMGQAIPVIVDGGRAQVGIESTVLDLTVDPPNLLRPGTIPIESLMAVAGKIVTDTEALKGPCRSPGQLPKHYAPKAKLVIRTWRDANDLKTQITNQGIQVSQCHVIAHAEIPIDEHFSRVSVLPHDPEAYARAIYAELHQCDAEGAEFIVVEAVPEDSEWEGVRDRMRRAAGGSTEANVNGAPVEANRIS